MRKLLRGLGWTAAILVLVALVLRVFVLKVWTLPTDPVFAAAVAPTLAGGDTVVVLTVGTPGFGDLVRCLDPEDPTKFVVGRIVGVDRDVVETEGARLWVNGKRYDAESACPEPTFEVPHPSTGSAVELHCGVVQMGSGWHYRGSGGKASPERKTRSEVGANKVYVLSDNRTFHDDSRDFGTLARSTCTEKIVFRLWGKSGWSDDKSRMTYIR